MKTKHLTIAEALCKLNETMNNRDVLDSKYNVQNDAGRDLETDGNHNVRGWIATNGEIISTNELELPHYEIVHKIEHLNEDELIRYNFGYERYIGLPKVRPTQAQYNSLLELLDYFFINQENQTLKGSSLEIDYDMNEKGDFKWKIFSPKTHTPDDIIKLIKRYYTTGVLVERLIREAVETDSLNNVNEMKGKSSINNEQILKYVDECIEEMKKLSFGVKNEEAILTYDDIDIKEGNTIHTFGTMRAPKYGYEDNFELVLNKNMFNEPEEVIKNTIYHELCHYVVDKIEINIRVIYYKNGGWHYNKELGYDIAAFKSHGWEWKHVASVVGKATGQNIERLGSYEQHMGVGEYAKNKAEYVVKCKHCGRVFNYARKTKFITTVLDGKGNSGSWFCRCPDGTKSHEFEILKGDN